MKKYWSTTTPIKRGIYKAAVVKDMTTGKILKRKIKELRVRKWNHDVILYYWKGLHFEDMVVYRDENHPDKNTYMCHYADQISRENENDILHTYVEVLESCDFDTDLMKDFAIMDYVRSLAPFKIPPTL